MRLRRFTRRVRRFDHFAELLLAAAFVCVCVGSTYAQTLPLSQDNFNGRVQERMDSYEKRIDRLESALNWAAAALILQLGAHALQISTQIKRRRRDEDDDGPRVIER